MRRGVTLGDADKTRLAAVTLGTGIHFGGALDDFLRDFGQGGGIS
jgi:hypothetical protein